MSMILFLIIMPIEILSLFKIASSILETLNKILLVILNLFIIFPKIKKHIHYLKRI
jgi:hypothetical protein